MFLKDCPYEGAIPRHLDPLLGLPCEGSERPLEAFLEIPRHRHHVGHPFGLHPEA